MTLLLLASLAARLVLYPLRFLCRRQFNERGSGCCAGDIRLLNRPPLGRLRSKAFSPKTDAGSSPHRHCRKRHGRFECSPLPAKGSYAFATQYQQRPAPRDGGLFKPEWFTIVDAAPPGGRKVRAWDLAATVYTGANDPDWTVGMLASRHPDGFYIEHIVRRRGSPLEIERLLTSTAQTDVRMVTIHLPQDPGQAGKAQAHAFTRTRRLHCKNRENDRRQNHPRRPRRRTSGGRLHQTRPGAVERRLPGRSGDIPLRSARRPD